GYEDNFNLDLGWSVIGDAPTGQWERDIPKPMNFIQMPTFDSPADPGDRAYVTGNKGFSLSDDDVDKGFTLLTSPPMQLRSRYNRPLLSYDAWFFNPNAATPADDSLTVLVSNGKETVILEAITEDTFAWRASPRFDLARFIEITDDMRIAFRVADTEANGHILEAGIDNFKVEEGLSDEDFGQADELVKMRFHPNPFRSELTIDYKVEKSYDELKLLVFNVLGQKIEEVSLESALGTVQLELDFAPGIYFVAFQLDGKLSDAASVVKGF
ncbi:MAG: T9SS type A sorting domain-containing protein, partial [Bacteroidota bacterium]